MSRTPNYDMSVFKKRRERIRKSLEDSALVIFSNPEFLRNYDAHYEYRQDTNFFYLTGFEEPESVFVYRPGQKPETVLFVRPKDLLRETWDGFRYGPDLAKTYFGVDETYLISELPKKLVELLKPVSKIYYKLKQHEEHDKILLEALDTVRTEQGRTGRGLAPILDSWELLGEYRLIKQDYDIKDLKKACELTAKAHVATMMTTRPGMNERQIEARLRFFFMDQLSVRMGYNPIVASGKNACTLHYNYNDQVLQEGDLLLIDAGSEYNYFSGDITRTNPIGGKYSKAQKEIYNCVLNVQKEIQNTVKPGIPFKSLQDKTISLLVDGMLDLKILKGNKEEIIKNQSFKKYYPHGVSHWLGMDVHDSGLYQLNGESRPLQAGMSFSNEPGIYVPYDDMDAPKEFRGIGVRIEDDILVTESGCENMTWMAPKEIDQIEALYGKGDGVGIDLVLEKINKAFENKKPTDLPKALAHL